MADGVSLADLLRELREEVRDWQDALCGERDGLDDLCDRVDAALAAPPALAFTVKPLVWMNCAALNGGRKLVAHDPFHNEVGRFDLHGLLTSDPLVIAYKAKTQDRYEKAIRSAIIQTAPDGAEACRVVQDEGRGFEDELLGIGRIRADGWTKDVEIKPAHFVVVELDMCEVAVFRRISDGLIWVRLRDGFKAIDAADLDGPGSSQPVPSSHDLIKSLGGDPDAPFKAGRFPPEMREPSHVKAEPVDRKALRKILQEAEAVAEEFRSGRNGKRHGKIVAASIARIEAAARALLT